MALSSCRAVPARAVTVIADRSSETTPVSPSGRSSTPSVRATGVNECPVPTIFTPSPRPRAARTASTTSAVLRGVSTWAG